MAQTSTPPAVQLGGDNLIAVPVHWRLRVNAGSAQVALGVTLTIHNLSTSEQLTVRDVAVVGPEGQLEVRLLSRPRVIAPLGTLTLTAARPNEGLSGTILVALDGVPATAALVQAMMAGDLGGRGYVMVTQGNPARRPGQ
jgi:hypothetical protein